jgi:heat shock protein HslJ
MILNKLAFILIAVGAAGLVSCGDAATGASEVRGEWRLVSLERPGAPAAPPPASTQFTLRLDDDGRLGVQADCNSCGGPYTLEGDSLTTGAVACTKVFCGSSAPFDSLFLQVLSGRSSIRVRDHDLELSSERGTLVFTRG